MFVREILLEKPVMSTWISDIRFNRNKKILYMTLGNGRVYAIDNFSRTEFERWHRSSSKGRFWHAFVKGFYDVVRIK
jgi:hypothetical protein